MELGKGLPGKGNFMCKGSGVWECVLFWRDSGKACESSIEG